MKDFLKPTRVTWFAMIFLCCMIFVSFLFSSGVIPDKGILTDIFAGLVIAFLMLPTILLANMGFIKLYSSSGFLPIPTVFGYVVSITTTLIIFYLMASVISRMWYKIKSRQL